ncbi:MAG: mechanosensitive ion channel protein MscS [Zetaproteobacteria bacterium CG_4_9_14_3_um_filter_49_83]|nr:MAG: mechanosensitive ion channel protein MscS [Zetaproteobacteria bacterium CG1_02_49_23]PIQ31004.1 MAG: mechanosensitive ion channel protein MscS [Zetaproteobacteria bacterium CG17_big_fil_post_rev_8_21_14_2_50_50_13]PIY56889.1 MAG: mechanosensitive ion channel protein MscS [Zetaproteobacteria bacterium CG_4_10_14_0_8_um_filter_49_80]PJA35855.1 MAG: mechanosensitive ion channel protein MscS [Zetaproteobacteria bacterium CG_4_9_14_3_um_filter_49_83]
MDIFLHQFQGINWEQIIFTSTRILIVLSLAWLAMFILQKILGQLEQHLLEQSTSAGEPLSESEKRVETLIRLIKQAVLILLWVTTILILLKEIGVDVTPVLASAGIVGLAVGFGAQNLVRDFIAGFFFILENQVRVGDVAIVNGTGGLVEEVNFRTLVLRDLGGIVHIFPNGTVTTLSNLTNDWSAYVFEIGVAYKENTDKVIEVMSRVGAAMKQEEILGSYMIEEPEIFGVDKFDSSAVVIKGRIKTKPIRQWQVGREYLRRIKLAFDDANIEIPFPHQTLYFGEASKPVEVALLEKLKNKK